LARIVVPELNEVAAGVYIKRERKKNSNNNLQQDYKRYNVKLTIETTIGNQKHSNSVMCTYMSD